MALSPSALADTDAQERGGRGGQRESTGWSGRSGGAAGMSHGPSIPVAGEREPSVPFPDQADKSAALAASSDRERPLTWLQGMGEFRSTRQIKCQGWFRASDLAPDGGRYGGISPRRGGRARRGTRLELRGRLPPFAPSSPSRSALHKRYAGHAVHIGHERHVEISDNRADGPLAGKELTRWNGRYRAAKLAPATTQ